ncbi:Alpha/Beta hydrolase protein, partial [Coniella lustricola]
ITLPLTFLQTRYLTPASQQPPFLQAQHEGGASVFQDIVIRCVRYAFANLDPRIGRVFFGKPVALPWLRWRMLRHGLVKAPVHWREYKDKNITGIWAITDPSKRPDIVLYYAHGGGFSMGSAYFYLEFLISWLHLLHHEAGYSNPAVFALDYTLVPEACFPTQLHQMVAGYEHALAMAGDSARVCVAGDSAGGTLVLSLLLHLAHPKLVVLVDNDDNDNNNKSNNKADKGGKGGKKVHLLPGTTRHLRKPDMSVLISPWPALHSPLYKNTSSDYLDADALQLYASQYAGTPAHVHDHLASPGDCKDVAWWRDACLSTGGIFIAYGQEEVFAPEIEKLVQLLHKAGADVSVRKQDAGIHAWPVVSLFLGDSAEQRLKGLRSMVKEMRSRIAPAKG